MEQPTENPEQQQEQQVEQVEAPAEHDEGINQPYTSTEDAPQEQQQEEPAQEQDQQQPADQQQPEQQQEEEQPQDQQDDGQGAPQPDPAAFAAAQAQAAALAAKFSEEGHKRKLDGYDDAPEPKRAHSEFNGGVTGHTTYGPGGETIFTMQAPSDKVGRIIGRSGVTIRELEQKTGCRIQVDHKVEGDFKPVTITGAANSVELCKTLVAQQLESDNNPHGGGMGGGGSGPEVTSSLDCPPGIVGRIIGRGGETIRSLQSGSGANIVVDQNYPPDQPRKIIIRGRQDNVDRAAKMITDLISGDPGSAQSVIQKYGVGVTRTLECPKTVVGRVIGKGGETIKGLQKQHGVSIQIDQTCNPCKITIAGQGNSVTQAERAVMDVIQDRPPMGGGMGGGPMGGGFGGPRPGFGGPAPGFGGGFPGPGFNPGFGGAPGGYGMPQPGYGGYGMPQPGYNPQAQAGFGGYGMMPQQQAAPQGQFGLQAGFNPQQQQGFAGGYGGMMGGQQAAADPYGGYQQQAQQQAQQQPQQQQQMPQQSAPQQQQAQQPWQEQRDDQGRVYYYNSITGVSQWERPAEFQ